MNERQKELKKATQKRYYEKHKAFILKRGNEWRKRNKDKHENSRLKGRYGITLATKKIIEEYQQGKCKICETKTKLFVDHSHATGFVRALLCVHCNYGLGNFKDKPELLEKAIKYLKTHKPVE